MKKNDLLQLKNVSAGYKNLPVLKNVDLRIAKGEIVALLGPNGSGKSTILKTIFGLVPNISGNILWKGKKIAPSPEKAALLKISFVPQDKNFFSSLSVKENIEIGMTDKNQNGNYKFYNTIELFKNLEKIMEKNQVSGGQRQMVALARGIINEPELLLLDEPTAGLSPKILKEIFKKIKEIAQERNTAILIVEHNIKSALGIADRAYIMHNGSILEKREIQDFQDLGFEKIFLKQ